MIPVRNLYIYHYAAGRYGIVAARELWHYHFNVVRSAFRFLESHLHVEGLGNELGPEVEYRLDAYPLLDPSIPPRQIENDEDMIEAPE